MIKENEKTNNHLDLATCPELVEFSDNGVTWEPGYLSWLEKRTLWPYYSTDGEPYKFCREIPQKNNK